MIRFGFIGTGNVASAILGAIIPAGLAKAERVFCYDINADRLALAREIAPFMVCESNSEVLEKADIIFIAVKPRNVSDVLEDIKEKTDNQHLFISVCAGITTEYIEKKLGDTVRIVRVMPNTPALIKCGASALSQGKNATEEDMALALSIFNVIGVAVEVEEKDLDAVTGLSGSGPAYIFYMAECMIKAGMKAGLNLEVADRLAKYTLLGAARMIIERKESIQTLREMVTTPGGTTAAGLAVMQDANFEKIIIETVKKAAERSRELGKKK
jgi:pyrroline-5-carboxylate reductase